MNTVGTFTQKFDIPVYICREPAFQDTYVSFDDTTRLRISENGYILFNRHFTIEQHTTFNVLVHNMDATGTY